MGLASAGSERRIDETASLNVPICLRMPSRSTEPPIHDQEKDVPGLLGLWTRAGVFVGRDPLSKGSIDADHAWVSPATR
jgi:hypothetical protein